MLARLAGIVAVARDLTGKDLSPVEVRLPLSQPTDSTPYRDFFRGTILFEADGAGLTFRASELNLPIPDADLCLLKYLEDYAQGLLEAHPIQDSLVSQIWRILMVRLPAGDPGIEGVAESLGLTVRTVQRRLKEQGTSYRELLDLFRQKTAQKLLANPRVAIKEIGFLLGYQDLGAFYRAFRRWEGCSPLDYRTAQGDG
jgi:AraC-like DNA-binding protein